MIKSLKRVSLAIPALLVAFTALAVVPVYASKGDSGSSDSTVTAPGVPTTESSKTVVVASTSGSDTTTAETETHTTSGRGSDSSKVAELRTQGEAHVAELKKDIKSTHTEAERTKVCEVHKKGLTSKFSVIARNSDSFQTRINDVYTKALAFQTSKNITSTELSALIATADSAKLASATSILNLQAVTPTMDCNNITVAQDVATFKVATTQTRTNLKAYKAAVKAVLQALKSATDTTTTPKTTGSN
ncbi:MAG: hypothetical protein ABI602_00125 [Candidatus Saccharibacteria bacterium]